MTYIDKKALNSRRTTVRNGLKNERDRAIQRQRDAARSIISRSEVDPYQARHRKMSRTASAVMMGTGNLAHKVLGAFGVKVPITMAALSDFHTVPVQAYTDFKRITVKVKPSLVNLKDMDSVTEFVFMVKGAVYHEGGHNIYTKPYNQLLADARKYAPAWYDSTFSTGDKISRYQRSWNIIEDQRMEMFMVNESPILERYFTSIVLNVVVDRDNIGMSWPYITGRQYMNYELRKQIRAVAKTMPRADLINHIDSVVARYRNATTDIAMLRCVVEFGDLLEQWGFLDSDHETTHVGTSRTDTPKDGQPSPQDSYPDDGEGDKADDKPESESDDKDDKADDGGSSKPKDGDKPDDDKPDDDKPDDDKQGDGGTDGKDEDDSPSDANQDGSNKDKGQDNPTSSQPSGGSDLSKPGLNELNDLIDQELQRAKATDAEAESFVSQINEEMRHELPRDGTLSPMPADCQATAMTIKGGIIAALEHLVDQTSPSWRFRLEEGVLDPTAYSLHEPGETDYWTGFGDIGQQGYDLSVSVMLDTSYSVGYEQDRLSIVGYAIRSACDELDIPCEVSTFNTSYGSVYRAGEQTEPMMVRADGGTSPAELFNYMDSQRYDKRRHLVVILTDGEWSNCSSLAPWSAPGRYILLVGFNLYDDSILRNKMPNSSVMINDVLDLPKHFTRALAGFLA